MGRVLEGFSFFLHFKTNNGDIYSVSMIATKERRVMFAAGDLMNKDVREC
jgi:hypothetical protein